MDDLNLILLSGGFARCTPAWNKDVSGIDHCYKVYAPINGQATVEMDDGPREIRPGSIYFISGFKLRRQVCRTVMEVYWLHFVPSSLYVRYLLDQTRSFHCWPCAKTGWSRTVHHEILRVFGARVYGKATDRLSPPQHDVPPSTRCRIQSMLLNIIAAQFEDLDDGLLQRFHPEFYRLKTALDFMEAEYASNPSLEQVAATVHLAPNYFHRRFAQLFGTTPFEYMLARRLNEARRLLLDSSLSIKQVAARSGYNDPLYFSRLFKARMQLTPQSYRDRYAPGVRDPSASARDTTAGA